MSYPGSSNEIRFHPCQQFNEKSNESYQRGSSVCTKKKAKSEFFSAPIQFWMGRVAYWVKML